MGEQVAHQMNTAAPPEPAPAKAGVACSTLAIAAFSPSCASEITSFTPRSPRRASLRKELGPERLGFGGSDFHAEDFASAIVVDADRDHDDYRDDAAGLTHLYISGIDPRTGSGGNRFPAAG
jgi:hypothetical protein